MTVGQEIKKRTANQKKSITSGKTKSTKGGKDERYEELYDDSAKEPAKILKGHTKAVREIAYSER